MDIDSEHKICRLCYNKSVYSTTTVAGSDSYIDIYSTAGIVQNCAQLITDFLHLDVTQNDEYSKSVCLMCWNRLTVFHEFYMYVNKIQKEYFGKKYHVVEDEYPYSSASPTTLNKPSAPSISPILGSIKHEDQPPSLQSLISLPGMVPNFTELERRGRPDNSNVNNGNKLEKLNDHDKNGQTTIGNITGGKRELELLKLVPAKKLKREPQKNDADYSAKLKTPPAVVKPQEIALSDTASDSDNTPLVWIISKNLGTASAMQDTNLPKKTFPTHKIKPPTAVVEPELSDSDDDNTPLACLISRNSGTASVMPDRDLSNKMSVALNKNRISAKNKMLANRI